MSSEELAPRGRPKQGCGDVFPHCTHSCSALIEARAPRDRVVAALEAAFEGLENFEPLERVRDGGDDGDVVLAGHFNTPKCHWLDRFEFRVPPTGGEGVTVVEAFGRSTSFVCGGCCPAPVRWLFCWMQCYGDNGLNRKNMQRVCAAVNEGGVDATLHVLYSSC